MELKRSYRFIIAFTSLFILISLVQDSYAKYLTSAKANTQISIAKWNILVNNSDIVSNNDFSNTIHPIFPGNDHTASNIVAPLSEGYFDITINYTDVDVSFNQIIELSHADDNTISDLIITEYSINNGPSITIDAPSAQIPKTILATDSDRIQTYRFFVKWEDGSGESMDNTSDTNATKNGVASIKVNLSFIQKPN